MADEQQNKSGGFLSHAASAANFAKGALKTGKQQRVPQKVLPPVPTEW